MKQIAAIIGGANVPGEGAALPVVNPSTGAVIAEMSEVTPAQVGVAVEAAVMAFDSGVWSDAPMADRRNVMRAAAAAIRDHADELTSLQVAENGMIPRAVAAQVSATAGWFDYYADYLTTERQEAYTQIPGATTLVERVPVGVVALFSPWNVPLALTAVKLAPALAAGNVVVVKPSEETPETVRRLIELVNGAGVPRAVLSLVNGRGAVTGAAVAEHPGVNAVSFTGGEKGGRAVAEAAARRQVPCVMELGGKSATLVFADADLDAAVEGAAMSVFGANGEACLAGSRVLVENTIADAFLTRFRAFSEGLTVGPADGEGVAVGPMVSAAHRDHVLGFYETEDEVLFGGPGEGLCVRPGAIRAAPGSRLWTEEVFGPLAAVATFSDETQAIQLANDSRFGLAGYLWTRDLERAHRIAKKWRTGSVIVNSTFLREPNAPFGGFGASGVGREGGAHSWANFTEARTTVIKHG